jgi:hypothetical protein
MIRRTLLAITLLVMLLPATTWAQSKSETSQSTTGQFGLRVGFGLDPDQFVAGAQVALGKKLGIARIVPSVDVGLGNSLTTIAFNGDALFRLNVEDASFGFYGGAGAGLVYADVESGGSSSWNLGLNLIAGARVPFKKLPPTSFEARFGVGDIPDFRGLLVFEL